VGILVWLQTQNGKYKYSYVGHELAPHKMRSFSTQRKMFLADRKFHHRIILVFKNLKCLSKISKVLFRVYNPLNVF